VRRQAVQNIADWLEKLGLSEYAQRFAECLSENILNRMNRL